MTILIVRLTFLSRFVPYEDSFFFLVLSIYLQYCVHRGEANYEFTSPRFINLFRPARFAHSLRVEKTHVTSIMG